MRFRTGVWTAAVLAAGMIADTGSAMGADLEVTVDGLRDKGGSVRAYLWKGPDGFPGLEGAVHTTRFSSRPGRAVLAFSDLAPGDYAVLVFHDEDDDGTLDRFLGMIPTEGWAYSNDPKLSGPPEFRDAAVRIDAPGTAITLRMSY